VPAVALALAPPSEVEARTGQVAVTASKLVPVLALAAPDRDGREQGQGDADVEVPVPEDDPEPAPRPAAEPSDSLPRTGLEVAALWGAGLALLSAGLALRLLSRRPTVRLR
jgi:hypothetical protein